MGPGTPGPKIFADHFQDQVQVNSCLEWPPAWMAILLTKSSAIFESTSLMIFLASSNLFDILNVPFVREPHLFFVTSKVL